MAATIAGLVVMVVGKFSKSCHCMQSLKYQQSTLGYMLWPGQFVDNVLGERVFHAAMIGIPGFETYVTEALSTLGQMVTKCSAHMCTVLKAMHLQYNESDESVKYIDTYICFSIEPQTRDLASTHLNGLVLYALPANKIAEATQKSFWSLLSDHLESYSDPRQLRRSYIESNPSFLLLYIDYERGCDHYMTGVFLNVEGLNASFGLEVSSKVSCKACYEAVLLDNNVIEFADWNKVDTLECMNCQMSYHICICETEKDEVLCTGCGQLLFYHGCSKCMVFTTEYGWMHCQKCDMCHRYCTACAPSDDLCVLCQLPLSDPRYSVMQLKCHKAHMLHSTCLLHNIVSGNDRCPYHCGSIFKPIHGVSE